MNQGSCQILQIGYEFERGDSVPFYHSSEDTIGILSLVFMFFQICLLIVPILLTEKALKRIFDEDGSRR